MKACSWIITAALALSCRLSADAQPAGAGQFDRAIEAGLKRVVKLYGGGFGREHGYGSGALVSPDGLIVTTLSVLIESPALRVVLPDGRRYPAKIVKRDQRRQLALLKIEVEGTAYFNLDYDGRISPGDWVVAASNVFKVADGPEPVSVSIGVLAGRADLAARRRAQDYGYTGEVLITDVIVAAPGAAGGVLLDVEGRFVGLIGKPVISKRTNTWINYALPRAAVAAFIDETQNADLSEDSAASDPATASARPDLGLLLFDVGGRGRPAYVERVRKDSPAHNAGVRPNDLVISLAGDPIETCAQYYQKRDDLRVGDIVEIVVKRGDEVLTFELTAGGRKE